jgi:hypothetical protein
MEMAILVRSVDVIHSQDGQVTVIAKIPQGNSLAWLEPSLVNGLLRHIQGDGHGEKNTASKSVILDDAAKAHS